MKFRLKYVVIVIIFVHRMVKSEDVQYFTFDEHGELFVCQPGSGFSGPSYKVEQGFEMNEITQNYQGNVLESQVSSNASSTESILLLQGTVKSENETKSAGVKRLHFINISIWNCLVYICL